MKKKVVVTDLKGNYKKLIPTEIDESPKWAFSFEYFNQIKYFGLDRSERKWFVSLIDRLKNLATIDRNTLFNDKNTKEFFRFHQINWTSTNIPIKRNELDWVNKIYLSNEDEYPFYQFQLSKANGRIVGFWNENYTVFFIVLLDPLHNIQPSKNFDYVVDDCYPLSCEYTSMHTDIHNIIAKKSNCPNCNIKSDISKIPTKLNHTNAIIGFLDDSFLKEYESLLEKMSLSEILELGILAATQKN